MFRPLAILASVSVLAIGAAACGDDEQSDSTPAKTTPAPVAQIDSLSGRSTAVTLDSGFVKALGSLKLTPGAGRHAPRSARPASPPSRSPAATSPTTRRAPSPRTCRA